MVVTLPTHDDYDAQYDDARPLCNRAEAPERMSRS